MDKTCTVIRIPKKKKGEFRTIYSPNWVYKCALRKALPDLEKRFRHLDRDRMCGHGFVRHRSPVTNAMSHVGHRYTLCMDIADFFDSVSAERLKGLLPQETIDLVTIDGIARQGLPTSPAAANIAATAMDKAIVRWIGKKAKNQVVYTRYADDLAFSFDDPALADKITNAIPNIAGKCGWKIKKAKTRLHDGTYESRKVCGINAGQDSLAVPRKTRRAIRALRHQLRTGNFSESTRKSYADYRRHSTGEMSLEDWVAAKVRGLEEWAKLSEPAPEPNTRMRVLGENACTDPVEIIRALAKDWRIKGIEAKNFIRNPEHEQELGESGSNVFLTRDPAYILGCSTYTEGWTSCLRMAPSKGQYAHTVPSYLYLRGAYIAALVSADKTATYSGIERPLMLARCWVFWTREGYWGYSRIYGNCDQNKAILRKTLAAEGIVPAKKLSGQKIMGHTPAKYGAPYSDGAYETSITKAIGGPWEGERVRTFMLL